MPRRSDPSRTAAAPAVRRGATPPLSVVMPVRNGLPFLHESLASLGAQSFADFELVIGDDGSSDGSEEVLRDYAARDSRVRLLRRDGGRSGHAGVGNWVFSEARASLVARLDADDLSYPDRLRRQVELFESEPDVQLVGTLFDAVDGKGRRIRPVDRWRLLRNATFAPFPHSSIMIRREAFQRAGGYRAPADSWEDLDLYLRVTRLGRILVVPEVLTTLRHAPVSDRLREDSRRMEAVFHRMYQCIDEYRRSGAYDTLLTAPPPDKLDPRAFVALGSLRLWSNARPRMLGPLLRRGDLRFDAETGRTLVWAAWGEISPTTLRWFLLFMLQLRNVGAARRLRGRRFVEWRPEVSPGTRFTSPRTALGEVAG